jgi:hypothetical protein
MTSASSFLVMPRAASNVIVWLGGILFGVGLWYLLLQQQMDLLCALLIGGVLLLVCTVDRSSGALLTLGYLTVMGDIRRIVAAEYGQPKLDLLLLVGPFVACVLAFPLLFRLRLNDVLSKAMLALLVVMTMEMFNPQQGGLAIGGSGAIFYIAPVLWFWIGRQLGSPRVLERLIYRCILPLGVAAAVMGLCQTFIGFLPYQQQWINAVATSYTALHLGGGTIRAFGFSVSGAEYATLVTFGAVGSAAAYFGPKRLWVLTFPLFVTAVVIASSRGLVLKLIFTLAIVWTLRKQGRLDAGGVVRLSILTLVGLIGVFGLASRFAPSAPSSGGKQSAVQNALEHQAVGLAHPLNQRYSTAGIHGQLILNGIVQGFVDPIGHGLGATTLASRKFGEGYNLGSSEIDFSDMFITLGAVGGLLYIFIICCSLQYAVRYVRTAPKASGLPICAILVSSVGAWMIGGMYSTTSLVLFLIGGLAYSSNPSLVVGTRSS